jgi:hypothetical protein
MSTPFATLNDSQQRKEDMQSRGKRSVDCHHSSCPFSNDYVEAPQKSQSPPQAFVFSRREAKHDICPFANDYKEPLQTKQEVTKIEYQDRSKVQVQNPRYQKEVITPFANESTAVSNRNVGSGNVMQSCPFANLEDQSNGHRAPRGKKHSDVEKSRESPFAGHNEDYSRAPSRKGLSRPGAPFANDYSGNA